MVQQNQNRLSASFLRTMTGSKMGPKPYEKRWIWIGVCVILGMYFLIIVTLGIYYRIHQSRNKFPVVMDKYWFDTYLKDLENIAKRSPGIPVQDQRRLQDLPSRYDLRDMYNLSSVRHQRNCASCAIVSAVTQMSDTLSIQSQQQNGTKQPVIELSTQSTSLIVSIIPV